MFSLAFAVLVTVAFTFTFAVRSGFPLAFPLPLPPLPPPLLPLLLCLLISTSMPLPPLLLGLLVAAAVSLPPLLLGLVLPVTPVPSLALPLSIAFVVIVLAAMSVRPAGSVTIIFLIIFSMTLLTFTGGAGVGQREPPLVMNGA